MKDYEITVKVRNNYLLTAMRRAGYWTAADLSRATGVSQTTIGNYLNLAEPATTRTGRFRQTVETIAEHLRMLPEDLFPPRHIEQALARNRASFEASLDDIPLLASQMDAPLLPDGQIEQREMAEAVTDALASLPDRHAQVLRARYGLDGDAPKTYEAIGKEMDITRERVRQIELRGLRKLGHRSQHRLRAMAPFAIRDGESAR